MFVFPQHLYEALTLPLPPLGFEDGACGRNLGLDEVMRVGPHDRLVSL